MNTTNHPGATTTDQHTKDLAKYYRSVGQRPADALRLAKENSASYIKPAPKAEWPDHSQICESGWTGDRCIFYLGHAGPHSND